VGDQFKFYTEPEPVPEDRIVEVRNGQTIDLGAHALAVHHAPGHAPHQVVFYDPDNDAVFTADAAGIYAPSLGVIEPTSPAAQLEFDAL
jgi:glyoxylase-like metal-dependent hydrolase (beta-lactamase superfamily II)